MMEPPTTRANAFQVFAAVHERIAAGEPTSVIRLGDGEGAVLGFPDITTRNHIDTYLRIWLRTTAVADRELLSLADACRATVRTADVVGVPRPKQAASHPYWRAVGQALAHFGLCGNQLFTDTALHRLLQHALLLRPLIVDAPFLGLISSRDVADPIRELFGVREVRWYGVRGERDEPGTVTTPHYPDGFETLRETLTVPFRGARFLVGAGVFGKIYCHWIKARGGIAIDIGSIFDSWAKVGRVGHPVRSLDCYRDTPRISRHAAIERYNRLIDHFGLDVPRAVPNHLPPLPEYW